MPLAAVLTAARSLDLQERAPLLPGTAEVLVAVEAAGICGTDLAIHGGDYPVPLPLVLGHEVIGRVREVGRGVDASWIGARVALEINNTCRAYGCDDLCAACDRALPSHCQRRTVTGIIGHDGGWAEEVVVPAGVLHPVPTELDPVPAVLVEPLAAAIQTFELSPAGKGDLVVVLGIGRLGSLVVAVAARRGARVVAVGRRADRRARALELGAAVAVDPSEARDLILAESRGLGADVVVEATGSPDGLALALGTVRPRGAVAAKTTCGLPSGGVDLTKLVVDEVRIQGSRCGPFAPAIALLCEEGARWARLVTATRPLGSVVEAVALAATEPKVVLLPGRRP